MKRYYEAKGEIRKSLLAIIDQHSAALQRARDFAIKHNGTGHIRYCWSYTGLTFGVVFDSPNDSKAKLWKPFRIAGWEGTYEPRKSTAEGKALAAEMEEIGRSSSGTVDIGNAIKMQPFADGEGFRWQTAGFRRRSKRLFVIVPDENYSPPKGVELTRISDVEFERLTAEKKPSKKAKVTA